RRGARPPAPAAVIAVIVTLSGPGPEESRLACSRTLAAGAGCVACRFTGWLTRACAAAVRLIFVWATSGGLAGQREEHLVQARLADADPGQLHPRVLDGPQTAPQPPPARLPARGDADTPGRLVGARLPKPRRGQRSRHLGPVR